MNCEVTTVNEMTRIAVDAVGGDFGAPVVLEGVEMALAEDPNLEVVICGPADVVEPFARAMTVASHNLAPKRSRWTSIPRRRCARRRIRASW